MLRRVWLVLALAMVCGSAQAATVYLKNGSSVSGKLLERTADNVKIEVSGVTLTYYNDELDRVEGEEAAATVPAKSEPAAIAASVVSAEPAAAVAGSSNPPAATTAAPAPSAEVPAAPVVNAPAEQAAQVAQEGPAAPEAPVPQAATSSEGDKKQLILKFIDVFGTKRMMSANFSQMMKSMTPEQADSFQKAIKVDDIIQALLPIYDKHFSEAELKTLIDFYSTPVGRKLIDTIPALMSESVEVSAKYFEAHMQELANGLQKTGGSSQPVKP
ncbi:MAG: DUF2059 domain-containing protein [Candidatus Omnitrophica bacterium]|nr:DUF2059 domain-containing protein [Candidatus Omnitrophota bacterium]